MSTPQPIDQRTRVAASGSIARTSLRAAAATALILMTMLAVSGRSGATETRSNAAVSSSVGSGDDETPDVTPDPVTDAAAARAQMNLGKAAILGVVEGVTEYLPVSSTGHLYVTQQLLGVGDTPETKAPADSFAIVIQAGAILAVLILYRRRIVSVAEGVIGRSAEGRTVLIGLVVAFLPAAVVGILAEDAIKSKLFAGWPIVAAWAVGGLAILALADRLQHRQQADHSDDAGGRANVIGTALEAITPKQALIIGVAQVIAMWPGTSRSLVTIVAAVLVGMSVSAAVEFSFLLGLGTLGAATAYETLNNGSLLVESYGGAEITVGLIIAFVTAAAAITWMVRWLERRSLAIFGWYRLVAAGVGAVLLLTGTITSTS